MALSKFSRLFQVLNVIKYYNKIRDFFFCLEMFQRLAEAQKIIPPGSSFPSIGALRSSDNMKELSILYFYYIFFKQKLFVNFT